MNKKILNKQGEGNFIHEFPRMLTNFGAGGRNAIFSLGLLGFARIKAGGGKAIFIHEFPRMLTNFRFGNDPGIGGKE